jgi:peptide/nickel transport system ATP-binding protein
MTVENKEPLLSIKNLCKYFPIYDKGLFKKQVGLVRAVSDVSFDLYHGETLGIVGESGCGKTTMGRCVLRAIDPTSGRLDLNLKNSKIDLAAIKESKMKPFRKEMQMIFQDPFASLNPRMTIGQIIEEPLIVQGMKDRKENKKRVDEMLEKVGLRAQYRNRYPHAFSGGQRQRVGIAKALILNPSLVVCDEAVSALDVSVQAQVVNLLQDLQEDLGLTYIFIAHDLSVVKHICDRVAVMYAGRIVELSPTQELFENPKHPYTQALLASIPNPNPKKPLGEPLRGEVADTSNLPKGCSFHPRCSKAIEACQNSVPNLENKSGAYVSCHEVKS